MAEAVLGLLEGVVHAKVHHRLLKLARALVSLVAAYLSLIGACILIFGAVWGIATVAAMVATAKKGQQLCFRSVRLKMGNSIALGLELLVATDVLETLTRETHEYSYELLGKIGAVAAFRTMLAFFLSREVTELREEEEKEAEAEHAGGGAGEGHAKKE